MDNSEFVRNSGIGLWDGASQIPALVVSRVGQAAFMQTIVIGAGHYVVAQDENAIGFAPYGYHLNTSQRLCP